MNLLLKADLAEAKAGRKGGYRLLRAPQDIPLLEVVEAAEGPLRPSRCTLSGGPCHWERMCALHPVWEEAHAALLDSLRRRTLASVVEVDRRLQAANYPVPDDSHRLSPEAT